MSAPSVAHEADAPAVLRAAPMDHELVVAGAKCMIRAASDLLELDDAPQEHCGGALEGIAESLGSALMDVLAWSRPPAEHDPETTRLIAALAEWLP